MPGRTPPRPYERLLLRPQTWAGRRTELVGTAACVAILALVFLGEIHTPPASVVGALAVVPVLVASWMLGWRGALAVVLTAVVLVLAEAAVHSIDGITGIAEIVAFMILAAVVRLYASRFDLLFPRHHRPSLAPMLTRLSQRERQVVELTIQGHTAPHIADLLHISERTVETHLANAYNKLGVSSKFDLVRRAAS